MSVCIKLNNYISPKLGHGRSRVDLLSKLFHSWKQRICGWFILKPQCQTKQWTAETWTKLCENRFVESGFPLTIDAVPVNFPPYFKYKKPVQMWLYACMMMVLLAYSSYVLHIDTIEHLSMLMLVWCVPHHAHIKARSQCNTYTTPMHCTVHTCTPSA